jgi:hypothetical protein
MFYDVAPDGDRFLVNTAPEPEADSPISLLSHWPAYLNRR